MPRLKAPIKLTKSPAWQSVGGLSAPSKMPGYGYSLPADTCITGSKLRQIEGSVCHGCYAFKGNYLYGNVQNALRRRMESVQADIHAWRDNMITVIRESGEEYFRWHDSGDVQSYLHLVAIAEIANALPYVRFWLPTKEPRFVMQYLHAHGAFPPNLTVRISAAMVGETANVGAWPIQTSSVNAHVGHACPARSQGNACGDCRACWDSNVKNVDYQKH